MAGTGPRDPFPSTSSGPLFGALPKPTGFLRRSTQRHADPLVVLIAQAPSRDGPDASGADDPLAATTEAHLEGQSSSKGSVCVRNSLPISDLSLSKVPSANSPVSSTQDIGPDASSIRLSGRRGSEFSTSTSHSANQHRLSLSSFVSSTGSPLATASSNGTTIGDLSTASMPLLPGVKNGRDDDQRYPWAGSSSSQRSPHGATSDSHSIAPSTSSRSRRVNSSSASISDASSVHSYPPKPRSSTSGSIDGLWNTGTVKSRRDHDGHSPVTRISSPATVILSPFAPLRKRLVRMISSGKRVGVEVQLIVELVDALEQYMRTFKVHLTPDELVAGESARNEVVNEVTLLLKELTEIAPEAQRCLAQGNYGPLVSSVGGARPGSSHSKASEADMFDSGRATWWPRRLVKDCPALASVAAAAESAQVLQTALEVEPAPETVIDEVLAGSEWDPLTRLAREPEVPPDLQAIAARREELLVEGRQRWKAYVSRSQLPEHQ